MPDISNLIELKSVFSQNIYGFRDINHVYHSGLSNQRDRLGMCQMDLYELKSGNCSHRYDPSDFFFLIKLIFIRTAGGFQWAILKFLD